MRIPAGILYTEMKTDKETDDIIINNGRISKCYKFMVLLESFSIHNFFQLRIYEKCFEELFLHSI